MEGMTTDRAFTLRRVIDAPPALVFNAWTEPSHLGWFFSGEGEPGKPEVDLRVDGAWRQTMVLSDDDSYVTGGVYREIVPGEKLVFAWGAHGGWPEPNADAPVVTVQLAPHDTGTELTFTLELPEHLTDDQAQTQLATGMRAGWGQTLDRLVQHFAAVTPPTP